VHNDFYLRGFVMRAALLSAMALPLMLQLALKICLPCITRAVHFSTHGLHGARDQDWSELHYTVSVVQFQIVFSLACIFFISILACLTLSSSRPNNVARVNGDRSGRFCQSYGALADSPLVERLNEGLEAGCKEPNIRKQTAIPVLGPISHPDIQKESSSCETSATGTTAKSEELPSAIQDMVPYLPADALDEGSSDPDARVSPSMAKFALDALSPQSALNSGQVASGMVEPLQCVDTESSPSDQDMLDNLAPLDKAAATDWVAHELDEIAAHVCEEVSFNSDSLSSQSTAQTAPDVPTPPRTPHDRQEADGDTGACFDLAARDSPRAMSPSPRFAKGGASRKKRVSLSHWWDDSDDSAGTASPADGRADLFEIGSPNSPVAPSQVKPRGRVSLSNWWEGTGEERSEGSKSPSHGALIAEVPSPTRRRSSQKPRAETRLSN